jgi:peptide/nickel transport system substrate-binding protein
MKGRLMRRSHLWSAPLALVAALSLGVAACGGSDSDSGSGSGEQSTSQGAPVQGKQGGKLTMLWSDDVDFIDPGATYYQYGFMVTGATQSPLYWYRPDDSQARPLLAESAPQISKNGKTVTVKIKQGVKFSPPVNRAVTSADVKYAIERGFFNTVNNGYVGAYMSDIKGAKTGVAPGTKIPGLQTPDKQTLVIKLTRPSGGTVAGALGMPVSAPVPESYAKQFDAKNPSTYGNNQVATGPYMIENNAQGKTIGYQPGRRIHLVRNPNWDKAKDFRPAYLNEIDMPEGNDDPTVASRKIITGQNMISGDFPPPPAILKQVSTRQKDQLSLVPSGGGRWIAMNNTIKPFDNINVRKAVIAGFDRNAERLTRGGALLGDIPTHFLPPGIPGFEQAGGLKGPGNDFLNTTGKPNMQLAAEYFKKAGYSSGKYEGNDELLMVGDSDGVAAQTAQVAKENFERLGFKVRLRLVTHDAMYTKYCNVPSAKVAICPNVGWFKDFPDPQTLLDPTFNGKNILPQNNSNWAQLNDPQINAAMAKAATLTDPDQRAQAWANIDKMITAQAPVIPWIWDKSPLIRSSNVNAVSSKFLSTWDVAWTSVK